MNLGFPFRHEYKFLLNKGVYLQLREVIKKIMKKDRNYDNEEGYLIRSLYFDDAYDTALFEKNLGFLNREKYRVRIYNFSDSVIKLEIKQKRNEYINKQSSRITRKEYERLLEKDVSFLFISEDKIRRKFYTIYRNKMLRPKAIVDYVREAYVLPYNQIRVTFDKYLSASRPQRNIFDKSQIGQSVGNEYSYILELKYNNFLPSYIRDVLDMYSLNRLAVSKYVLCREYLDKQMGENLFG